MTARVYAARVTELSDPRLYEAALSAVSPERREKTLRYRRAEDRRLSLGAALLLRRALGQAGISEYSLCRTPEGKPYLRDGGAQFSLSHSGEWAVCAVADRPVGCDVEKIRETDLAVARRFFTKAECDDLFAVPVTARQERFFRYWTLKESYLKVTGQGLKLPLDSFSVRLSHPLTVTLAGEDAPLPYAFSEYTDLPGYRCALCIEGGGGKVPLIVTEVCP